MTEAAYHLTGCHMARSQVATIAGAASLLPSGLPRPVHQACIKDNTTSELTADIRILRITGRNGRENSNDRTGGLDEHMLSRVSNHVAHFGEMQARYATRAPWQFGTSTLRQNYCTSWTPVHLEITAPASFSVTNVT